MRERPTSGEILFHHPFPLSDSPGKGSQLRPRRMLDAFGELGYEVVEVTGFSAERARRMLSLRRDLRRGRRFEFCYAECVNSPTPLSDSSHLPLHPFADALFFRDLGRARIPSSMFYRDIYWRFDHYREAVPLAKRLPAQAFYHFDLAWYARWVDIVYLPSGRMARAVPRPNRFDLRALPPGTVIDARPQRPGESHEPLCILYIGSISPPYYDIGPLLRAVHRAPGVQLTLNFPPSELAKLDIHPAELLQGVALSHAKGEDVMPLYRRADIASVVLGTDPYRDFAVPVKLLEAIGAGTPCLVNAGTAAADIVETGGFGWSVKDESDLVARLNALVADPEEVSRARERVVADAENHTWRARALQVATDLTSQPAQ